MFGKIFVIVVLTTAMYVAGACSAGDNDPKTVMPTENKEGESAELNQAEIMLMCNESFRTSMGT